MTWSDSLLLVKWAVYLGVFIAITRRVIRSTSLDVRHRPTTKPKVSTKISK